MCDATVLVQWRLPFISSAVIFFEVEPIKRHYHSKMAVKKQLSYVTALRLLQC